MFLGLIYGIIGATCQSFSYLFSRRYVNKYKSGSINLLLIAHPIMCVCSFAVVGILWPETWPEVNALIVPLFLSTLFYLCGQSCFFFSLKHSEASRITPLLSFKVMFLAIISFIFLSESYSILQWLAIWLCVCGAMVLNNSGSRISIVAVLWVLGACLFYSLSDIYVKKLVHCFSYLEGLRSGGMAAALSYSLSGIISIPILILTRQKISKERFKDAFPFALCWLAAMLFIYGCFGIIGVVFGNIVQSSRGIIAIVIGMVVAMAGYEHLEERITKKVFIRRFLAAAFMTGAIAIFYLEKMN